MIRRLRLPGTVMASALIVLFTACSDGLVVDEGSPTTAEDPPGETVTGEAPTVTYRTVDIINTYPHDPTLFTQGLEFADGLLVESAGGRGTSSLQIYDPANGTVIADHDLEQSLFAEGATIVDDEIWQLTWQAEKALVYSLDGLELINEVAYDGEGWGLCLLDGRFVMSDGSDQLTFRTTTDFATVDSVSVRLEDQGAISSVNELECVADGRQSKVWANIWKSTDIIGIDPATGRVTDVVDASSLVPDGYEGDTERVLNGIAVHPDTGRFWLTGKEWPVLYEVELTEP